MSESWTTPTEKEEQTGPELSMLGSPWLQGRTPGREGKVAGDTAERGTQLLNKEKSKWGWNKGLGK